MLLIPIAFYGAMLTCALPRRLVHVRVKQVLAGLLMALGVVIAVAAASGGDHAGYTSSAKGGAVAIIFLGAELMYTDNPRLRRIGRAVMWIALVALVLLVLAFPAVYLA